MKDLNSPAVENAHAASRRPLSVYPVALACLIPAGILVTLLALDPSRIYWSLHHGSANSFVFIFGIVFAFGLALAGALLFFLRKSSIWVLAASLLWCLLRATAGPPAIYAAAAFALGASLVLAYCLYLKRRGLLR